MTQDLDPPAARELLDKSKVRAKIVNMVPGYWGPYAEAEILINGKWIFLGSTDLFDDVCVGNCFPVNTSAKTMKAYYRKKIRLGGCLRPKGFSVISHCTDG